MYGTLRTRDSAHLRRLRNLCRDQLRAPALSGLHTAQRDTAEPSGRPKLARASHDRRVAIKLDLSQLPAPAVKDPTCWFVAVYDNDGRRLHRRDATPSELAEMLKDDDGHVTLTREFPSEAAPASWTVRPHSASAGWLEPVTGAISDCAGSPGPDHRPA